MPVITFFIDGLFQSLPNSRPVRLSQLGLLLRHHDGLIGRIPPVGDACTLTLHLAASGAFNEDLLPGQSIEAEERCQVQLGLNDASPGKIVVDTAPGLPKNSQDIDEAEKGDQGCQQMTHPVS